MVVSPYIMFFLMSTFGSAQFGNALPLLCRGCTLHPPCKKPLQPRRAADPSDFAPLTEDRAQHFATSWARLKTSSLESCRSRRLMLHYVNEHPHHSESRNVLLRGDVLRIRLFWREEMAGLE
jgi:hypothetical protein